MISRRFLAALLMLKTSAGYRPVVVFWSLSPRLVDCATPLTVSDDVCSGNEVGMPALRRCAWKLWIGRDCRPPPSVLGLFHRNVVLYYRLLLKTVFTSSKSP